MSASGTQMTAAWRRMSPLGRIAAVALVAYSLMHFGRSAVWLPLVHHGMVQAGQEMRPVQRYILRGRPVGPDNYRQYGPTFLFIMHGFLTCCAGPDPGHLDLETAPPAPDHIRLSRSLFALEIVSFFAALWFVLASVRLWLEQVPRERLSRAAPYAGAAIVLIWLNYTPFYEIIDVKTVEAWEVCLLSAAMYAHLRGKDFWTGFCVAAAALMKWLPGFFFLFLLLRNRRALVFACLSALTLLSISHAVYGPELGLLYPLLPIKASAGNAVTILGHASFSFHSLWAKALGHFPIAPAGEFQTADSQSVWDIAITPERVKWALRLGNACSAIVLAWTIWALTRRRDDVSRVSNEFWGWALATAVMFVLPPIVSYEYATLVVPAFSVAAALLIAQRWTRRSTYAAALFAVGLLLVGNIVPRSLVQRLVFVNALIEWTGYTHFTPNQGYYNFGFPMYGVLMLIVALWIMRPDSPARSGGEVLGENPRDPARRVAIP